MDAAKLAQVSVWIFAVISTLLFAFSIWDAHMTHKEFDAPTAAARSAFIGFVIAMLFLLIKFL